MKDLKVIMEGQFAGYNTKKNGEVNLKMKFPYSELLKVMSLVKFLNVNISVSIKINGGKPMALGTFFVDKMVIDKDGQSTISFNTELSSAEITNFSELATPESIIHFLAKASIDEEEEEDE